jgi:hypothetical protein
LPKGGGISFRWDNEALHNLLLNEAALQCLWERLSSRDHRGLKPLPHLITDSMASRVGTGFEAGAASSPERLSLK